MRWINERGCFILDDDDDDDRMKSWYLYGSIFTMSNFLLIYTNKYVMLLNGGH